MAFVMAILMALLRVACLAAITVSFLYTYLLVTKADYNSRFTDSSNLDPGIWPLYLSRMTLSVILRKVWLIGCPFQALLTPSHCRMIEFHVSFTRVNDRFPSFDFPHLLDDMRSTICFFTDISPPDSSTTASSG